LAEINGTKGGPCGGSSAGEERTLQLRVLEALTTAENYNRWIADLALPFLGHDPLEIGSGLGEFASLWLSSGVDRITVSELDRAGVTELQARFAGDPRVEAAEIDITGASRVARAFSSVVAINVLEHVRDDVAALREARALLEAGGFLILFVPAHGWAMSTFDRAIGHWRRYTIGSLRGTIEAAGLNVDTIRYVNAPGLLAWFVGMKLLRRTPTDVGAVHLYDRFVVPVTRRVERRVTPPFGQSLFAVGRAPR